MNRTNDLKYDQPPSMKEKLKIALGYAISSVGIATVIGCGAAVGGIFAGPVGAAAVGGFFAYATRSKYKLELDKELKNIYKKDNAKNLSPAQLEKQRQKAKLTAFALSIPFIARPTPPLPSLADIDKPIIKAAAKNPIKQTPKEKVTSENPFLFDPVRGFVVNPDYKPDNEAQLAQVNAKVSSKNNKGEEVTTQQQKTNRVVSTIARKASPRDL